jgi:hypothetical protein
VSAAVIAGVAGSSNVHLRRPRMASVAFASEPKAMEFEKYLKSVAGAEFVRKFFL